MKNTHSRVGFKGLARKLICCVAAGCTAVAFAPTVALGADIMSTSYALPTADQVMSFDHTGTDANGNTYNYRYVTIGYSTVGRVAPMMATWFELIGLDYINAYNGPSSIYQSGTTPSASNTDFNTGYTTGTQGSLMTRNSSLAILGTDNNENPDEYIWNYCCMANGATSVTADMRTTDGQATSAVSLSIGGTEYSDFPREVYTECDIIGATGATATYGNSTWAQWISLENQRTNRPKSGKYNPYFASFSVSGMGAAGSVKVLRKLAETVDGVIAQSKDANGNYTLQTRYGGNTANGASATIDRYEDFVKGIEYYTLSKIADKTVNKRVTAVLVGYDPNTGNYACRKSDTAKDPDGNQYGGRVINYASEVSTNICDLGLTPAQDVTVASEKDYVVWYTPKQIVENCDATFVCDAYSSNNVSTYLATSSDNQCHTVYAPARVSTAEEDNTAGLVAARDAAIKAGKDHADFCFSFPCSMFGSMYAQGVENGMHSAIVCSFTYPELFNLTDLMGYWAKYMWHIKDSRVQSVVEATCSGMDLPGGTKIGKVSANYIRNAEAVFQAGNKYYLNNMTAIDALNSGNLATYSVDGLKARVANYDAANAVMTKIDKLGPSSTATAVKACLTAYNKLSDDQKALVTNYATLNAYSRTTTVTVNVATVNASAVTKAYKAAPACNGKVTTIVLGTKVAKISASSFKSYSAKTLNVKTTKLTKAKIKNCLKSSKITTVKVPSKKLTAYKKIFTKAICGKAVTVKKA